MFLAKRPLRVWLVQIGEQLAIDPGPPRLLRTALLARELSARGHDVTYWNAGFIHQQKQHRANTGSIFEVSDGLRVGLLEGRAYSRNISFARIISHFENARSFAKMTRGRPVPDVLLCGLPSIELADAATRYARKHRVPIAVDCRDLWPDIIVDQLKGLRRFLAAPILRYWERAKSSTMRRATAITGVSEGFVEWGIAASGRARRKLDKPFHLAAMRETPGADAERAAAAFWDAALGNLADDVLIGVYAGTLSSRFDLVTIAEAVRSLPTALKAKIRIVLCGEGDVEARLQTIAADEPSLIVPGWRSATELQLLMGRADFGLLPYPSSRDFSITFPNKVGEYLSYGLPIMTGLSGVTGDLLDEVRLRYETGNRDSAAQALTDVIARPDDLTKLRSRALEIFNRHFDPASIYPAFADYLEELADWDFSRQPSSM